MDYLEWRVRDFLSIGGFLGWRSKYLSSYNLNSSLHFLLTFQIQFSNHNTKPSKFGSILQNPFQIIFFNLEIINTIFPNLRETPKSCIAITYLRKTQQRQTSSKQSCFASNQTRTFPNLKSFIPNLNYIIYKPQISPITFGAKPFSYPSKLYPILLNYHKPISNLPKPLDHPS